MLCLVIFHNLEEKQTFKTSSEEAHSRLCCARAEARSLRIDHAGPVGGDGQLSSSAPPSFPALVCLVLSADFCQMYLWLLIKLSIIGGLCVPVSSALLAGDLSPAIWGGGSTWSRGANEQNDCLRFGRLSERGAVFGGEKSKKIHVLIRPGVS